jgi:hypothetical protein
MVVVQHSEKLREFIGATDTDQLRTYRGQQFISPHSPEQNSQMHFKIRGSKARQIKEERHIINHSMILYFIKPRTHSLQFETRAPAGANLILSLFTRQHKSTSNVSRKGKKK